MSTRRFARTSIVILSVGLLTVCGTPLAGEPFAIDWYTIDSGGVMQSTGGGFEMSATIGQPDAGIMFGGGFQLTGGFWFEQPPGDCNATGFADLFDHSDFADCPGVPHVALLLVRARIKNHQLRVAQPELLVQPAAARVVSSRRSPETEELSEWPDRTGGFASSRTIYRD